MQMKNGLASSRIDVDPDVEPIRGVEPKNVLARLLDPIEQGDLLLPTRVKPSGNVPSWNDQGVAG
jgi:hypothetical protein